MKRRSGVTILELIISLCIFSLIFAGFASIQYFGRDQFLAAKRRTIVQNDCMLMLEHLAKTITGGNFCGGAIGDWSNSSNYPLRTTTGAGETWVGILVDTNNDGKFEPAIDGLYTYIYKPNYTVTFCTDMANRSAEEQSLTGPRIVGNLTNLVNPAGSYIVYSSTSNYVDAQVIGRWDPSKAASKTNPQVVMHTRIKMPSVAN